MWGPPSHARPHNPLPGRNTFKRPTGKTPRSPTEPPVPPGESPRPAAAPVPASASSIRGSSMVPSRWGWTRCPAALTPSHCRGDEPPREPPAQGPPVLRCQTLPTLHSCTGSAGPARPHGQRELAVHLGSPAGPKSPPVSRPTGVQS